MADNKKRIGRFLSGAASGPPSSPMVLQDPLVVMFQQDGQLVCHIHPAKGVDHRHYGIAICDLVRHVARAYKVDDDEVWKWVDKERGRPTSDISQPS
jgi:hypothetical protein